MTAARPAPLTRAQLHGSEDDKSPPRSWAARHSNREGGFTC
jgi:hypothetical protein